MCEELGLLSTLPTCTRGGGDGGLLCVIVLTIDFIFLYGKSLILISGSFRMAMEVGLGVGTPSRLVNLNIMGNVIADDKKERENVITYYQRLLICFL